jgi:hypothetical protein
VYDIQILASHHIHIKANKICIHMSNNELEEAAGWLALVGSSAALSLQGDDCC